jgi:selenocysteine lyase/cysteine desulfurase
MPFDPNTIRADFPILKREINGHPLVYLDNAASAQKPRAVIDAMVRVMETSYANVHRGLHTMANETTEAYEGARESVRRLLNAESASEIIFTKGGTEAINLVASSLGLGLKAGDEIVLTEMEHHANIVPWHFLRERKGVVLRFAPITDDGRLDLAALEALIGPRTHMVALTHMSNVLGTINPVAEVIAMAHAHGGARPAALDQAVHHRFELAVHEGSSRLTAATIGSPSRSANGAAAQAVRATSTPNSSIIWLRIKYFWILPVTVIGKASTKRMWRGIL